MTFPKSKERLKDSFLFTIFYKSYLKCMGECDQMENFIFSCSGLHSNMVTLQINQGQVFEKYLRTQRLQNLLGSPILY